MNQKGFANIVLIIVVIILVGTVGYFALRKPTPAPTTPTNKIANWKIYNNDEYGFEVKYPNKYSIKTDTYGVVRIGNTKIDSLYSIVILDNPTGITSLQYAEKLKEKGVQEHYAPMVRSYKSITINGVNGAEAVLVGGMGVPFRNIYFPVKNKFVNISYALGDYDYALDNYFDGNKAELNEYLESGDLLVSSFRFIK